MLRFLSFYLLFVISLLAQSKILIPMDLTQNNHLKAYGVAYKALEKGFVTDWLLNYRGGSFLIDYSDEIVKLCQIKEVSYQIIDNQQTIEIYSFVQNENNNMDVMRLEKAPKIAVYVPPYYKPWDDAVVMALEYAEVPYTKLWIKEILNGDLKKYDWLHLFHEDFTGQYGKFYASYANSQWYIEQQTIYEQEARKLNYKKVSKMLLDVVLNIKSYIADGGFLFAMCSATDTYDIALAAQKTDICHSMFDNDPIEQDCQKKLDFSQTLAFENFKLELDPYIYEYSNIDIRPEEVGSRENDYFTLFEFSAKYDPVPTMLTQCHTNMIAGFMGQTTAFRKELIKKSVIILAEKANTNQVKYLHGNYGRGTFTFYGGHDPEDYQHAVGDPPTNLELYKNSPGYRLILNNILFPAAKKKKQKT